MNAATRIVCALVALALIMPAIALAQGAEDSERVWVTVSGFGATDEEARKNAWATAVSQVVGTLVDSETVVKNDQLIRDEVLEFSDGYIETFNILSRTQDGEVVTIQMEALVRRSMVRRRLRELAVIEVAVDGLGLAAQIQTRHQRARDARAMLSRALEPFVEAKYLSFRDLRQLEISLTDRGARVPYRVGVGIDEAAYRSTAAALIDTLDGLGLERMEVPLRVEETGEVRIEATVRETIASGPFSMPDRGLVLTVQRGMSAFVYPVPFEFVDSEFIENHFASPALIVRLSLVDSHNVEIIAVDQCLGERSSSPPCDRAADLGVRGVFGDVTGREGRGRFLFLTGLNAGSQRTDSDRRSIDRFETIGFDVEVTIPQAERVHRARVTLDPHPALGRHVAPATGPTSADEVVAVAQISLPDEGATPAPQRDPPGAHSSDDPTGPQRVVDHGTSIAPDAEVVRPADQVRREPSGKRLHALLGGGVGFLTNDAVIGGLESWPGPTGHAGIAISFTDHVGLLLMFGWVGHETEHDGGLQLFIPQVQGSITFLPSNRIKPYLRFGAGAFIVDHIHDNPLFDIGGVSFGLSQALGVEFALSRSLALYLQQEFRHFFPSPDEPGVDSGGGPGIAVGLSFSFLDR